MELGKHSTEQTKEEITENKTETTKLVLITNSDFKGPTSGVNDPSFHFFTAGISTDFQDISLEDINSYGSREVAPNTIYVCDMQGRTAYKYLEYLEVNYSTEMAFVTVEVNYKLSEWNASISLISFTQSLKEIMQKRFSIFSEQENLYDEDLFHIKFRLSMTKTAQLSSHIKQFAEKLEMLHRDIFARYAEYQLKLAC